MGVINSQKIHNNRKLVFRPCCEIEVFFFGSFDFSLVKRKKKAPFEMKAYQKMEEKF